MTDSGSRRDDLAERLSDATAGTLLLYTVYVGDELGFYEELAGTWLTSDALAAETGTHERYVREWLEQQAVAGVVDVEDERTDARNRRYRLPPALEPVLLDRDSVDYTAQQAHLVVGGARPLAAVVDAFRTGEGVPFDAYGPLREGQARTNRAELRHRLPTDWLPELPGLEARLRSDDSVRVADVGCGAGWAGIGIAETYSNVTVDGFDLDEPSVERARTNVAAAGLEDRVTVHRRDVGTLSRADEYDLAVAVEVVHDLPNPVAVLDAVRRLVAPDGEVLVVDQRVADAFTTDVPATEEVMYGWSVVHCLPVGMNGDAPAGTGTVMRESTVREYASAAGFDGVEVLPIDHDAFRFYRLVE